MKKISTLQFVIIVRNVALALAIVNAIAIVVGLLPTTIWTVSISLFLIALATIQHILIQEDRRHEANIT